jgi:hypothetical protein
MLCCWSSLFWYTDYKSTRTFRTAKGLVLGEGDQKANPRPGHAVGLLPSTFQFPPHIQPRQTHSPANTFIFLSNDRYHDINHERLTNLKDKLDSTLREPEWIVLQFLSSSRQNGPQTQYIPSAYTRRSLSFPCPYMRHQLQNQL